MASVSNYMRLDEKPYYHFPIFHTIDGNKLLIALMHSLDSILIIKIEQVMSGELTIFWGKSGITVGGIWVPTRMVLRVGWRSNIMVASEVHWVCTTPDWGPLRAVAARTWKGCHGSRRGRCGVELWHGSLHIIDRVSVILRQRTHGGSRQDSTGVMDTFVGSVGLSGI